MTNSTWICHKVYSYRTTIYQQKKKTKQLKYLPSSARGDDGDGHWRWRWLMNNDCKRFTESVIGSDPIRKIIKLAFSIRFVFYLVLLPLPLELLSKESISALIGEGWPLMCEYLLCMYVALLWKLTLVTRLQRNVIFAYSITIYQFAR